MILRRTGGAAVSLLLAFWFGSFTGFAINAPILFNAELSRQAAGDLAGRMIVRLTESGLVAGVAALALILLLHGVRDRARALLVAGALVIGFYLWYAVIPPLRAPLPQPIDQYAQDDPVRVAYNRLHKQSERLASAVLLLVAGAVAAGGARKE